MQMIMFVLDDPELLDDVLDAWHAVGVNGATIVESTGLHRRRAQTLGARFSFGFPRVVERIEEGHFTLFVIVPDEQVVRACLAALEHVVGDLGEQNTGVFASWELAVTAGTLDTPSELEASG